LSGACASCVFVCVKFSRELSDTRLLGVMHIGMKTKLLSKIPFDECTSVVL
jgi:hypothetical protein